MKKNKKRKKVLPKPNRLQKNKDIEKVFKKGKKFKENFLVLKIAPNNLDKIRFGFIVPQKFFKKATLRNKIRRKLRELIALKLKKIRKGIDVILIATPGLETKDFWEIDEVIDRLFKKARLINKTINN